MFLRILSLTLLTICSLFIAESAEIPGKKSDFHGFERVDFDLNNFKCIIVKPKKAAEGNPWILRARFFGHQPQADLALLEKGFHLAYCDVANLFGSPKAMERVQILWDFVDRELFLAPKVVLEGMSRGGLVIYNWAAKHPDRVACIIGDAPVCDFKSWPMGNGDSEGSAGAWKLCKEAYGFKSDEEALAYKGNPIDNLKPLAKAKIPILHVVGDADKVVPVHENTAIIEKRYKKLGGSIQIINKPGVGHHPHALKDPTPIVNFVLQHTIHKTSAKESTEPWASDKHIHRRGNYINSYNKFTKEKKGHVAFIGGSITQMEGYRPMVQTYLKEKFSSTEFQFTDAGISSTCSTTGAFRLKSHILDNGQVDLFFVEFAVNDDQDAAHSREACIRGIEGMVRNLRTHSPYADIVMTFFVNDHIRDSLIIGQEPLTPKSHTEVAEYYNISTIHLAAEVSEQIKNNQLSWTTFGGVHPKPFGNRICTIMIQKLLNKACTDVGEPEKHTLPKPMDINSYSNGRFIPLTQASDLKGFKVSVPDWKSLKGGKRKQFTDINILHADQPGSSFKIDFKGRALGAYMLAGPDAGIVEVSVDGGPFKSFDLYHRYSKGLHYPRTVVFAHDLSDGEHSAVVRISDKTSSAGTALRIMHLCGN